jgi:glycosyltransferase involved in cell wall biosynthesis
MTKIIFIILGIFFIYFLYNRFINKRLQKDKLNICIMTDYLPPQTNGIAIRIMQYIRYIRLLGHNLTVYGPPNSKLSDYYLYGFNNPLNKENNIGIFNLKIIFDIIINRYDIIHAVAPPALFIIPLLPLINLFGIKLVISNDVNLLEYNNKYNMNPIINFIGSKIISLYYGYLLFYNQVILAPSPSEELFKLYNYKTILITSGVDVELFSYKNTNNNIISYVGRLAPEKNIDILIQMFSKIDNYILQIIGFGPSENMLKELAKDNKNIIFIGKIEHDMLPSYYMNSFATITCSLSETFGFTQLESLSCGTPILYPHCKVFDDLYYKDFPETSFSLNNIEQLKKSIKYLENNNIRMKCRQYAEKKSWMEATKNLIEIFRNTC